MLISRARSPRASPVTRLRCVRMSADGEKVVLGSVVRRPSEEVVREMAEIAVYERNRMFARAPPTPMYPGRFPYSSHRPLPHRAQINPVPPPSPERLRVAAVRQREHAAEEARFLEEAKKVVGRPRTPTPPRAGDDPYGFAKWAQRRY